MIYQQWYGRIDSNTKFIRIYHVTSFYFNEIDQIHTVFTQLFSVEIHFTF